MERRRSFISEDPKRGSFNLLCKFWNHFWWETVNPSQIIPTTFYLSTFFNYMTWLIIGKFFSIIFICFLIDCKGDNFLRGYDEASRCVHVPKSISLSTSMRVASSHQIGSQGSQYLWRDLLLTATGEMKTYCGVYALLKYYFEYISFLSVFYFWMWIVLSIVLN